MLHQKQIWLLSVKSVLVAVKNFIGICKNKYDCQMRNIQGIIEVKEQIWLPNTKY